MTVALKESRETVPAKTFHEIKQDTANLEGQNLSKTARTIVVRIREHLENLQRQLEPHLSIFSPEKARERNLARTLVFPGQSIPEIPYF